MLYLGSLQLPDDGAEFTALYGGVHEGTVHDRNYKYTMTCYENTYPFGVFPKRELTYVEFAPITIFAGGNGSGKSTLLNVIAEKLDLSRSAPFNTTPFFRDYIKECRVNDDGEPLIPRGSRIITSDDVFQSILKNRRINEERDAERDALIDEYWTERDRRIRGGGIIRGNILKYEEDLKRSNLTMGTPSKYVKAYLSRPAEEASNGECALKFFTDAIGEDALFLLDEPENSLSPVFQVQLASFLLEAARFYGCQLVIATHSPILMAYPNADILEFSEQGIQKVSYRETEHYKITKQFIDMPERMIQFLLNG